MKRSIVSHPLIGLWLISLLILLSGCESTPTHRRVSEQPIRFSTEQIERVLSEARLARSPARDNLILQAADMLIRQGQTEGHEVVTPQALSLLFEILPDQLTLHNLAIYTRWYGQWALDNHQQELAQRLIDNETLASGLATLDVEVVIPVHTLRIHYFLQTEQVIRAIDEHMALAPLLLNQNQQQQHQASLWLLLQQLSAEDRQLLDKRQDKQIHGWLELLAIATAQELDLDEQITQLEAWLEHNPRHPAAQALPTELQLLLNATRERPQHLTLLLPLSGNLQKAGEAIRDGFFAAYYQAMRRGYPVPQVDVVDSHSADFMELYEKTADSGTQLIIGPLEKENVALLKKESRLPVLTLALNDSADSQHLDAQITDRLFLFGLNPEDEARQIARQARLQHQRALVIAPNNDWGQRISNAFITDWLPHNTADSSGIPVDENHQVLGSTLFDTKKDDYSTLIQQALGIEDSQNRMRRIKQWISGEIEFEPRRRQDIDMIFLAARPEQARQIKPLLTFHYAGDIPVYASSAVYSGENNPDKDNDLNGTLLLVSPWLLNNHPLKNTLESQLPLSSGLQNLYALGADSWRLHARLGLLANNAQSRLHGNTGILQIEPGQRITRQQFWARMDRGKLVSLPGKLP